MNKGAILEATPDDGEADVETTVALEFEEGTAPSERPGCAPSPQARPALLRTDTLTESLISLFVLAIVQRIIGFGRSVMVCGWLPPDQLGEWDLANRFLVLAAPLVVLGLPGSFGRYLEHYRQRGVLRSVLMRTTLICSALVMIAVLGILSAPHFVAEQIFSRADRASNVALLAVGLVAVIAYNYLTEMLTALRLVRVTSLLEFLNSIGFATLSIVLLALWRVDAFAIVAAYAGSCLLLVLAASTWLMMRWSHVPRDRAHVPHSEMWRKLVPFAAWVWVTNLLYNAFEVADRYMLLHVGSLPDAQSLVGQYHSAQLIPLLMVSAAGLLAGIMLPHLSRDWEAGWPERVSSALNLALTLLGLAMFAGSVLAVLVAPLLFNGVWDGKYADGLALLPLTLVSCSWLGLLTLAQMYMWCAERARLGCISLAIGLATNVALNLVLIPHYGLAGAVTASTISKFVVLAIVFASNRWLGMQLTRGVCLVVLLPIGVSFGPSIAVVLLIGTGLAVVRTNWLLGEEEKLRVQQVWCNLRLRGSESKPA